MATTPTRMDTSVVSTETIIMLFKLGPSINKLGMWERMSNGGCAYGMECIFDNLCRNKYWVLSLVNYTLGCEHFRNNCIYFGKAHYLQLIYPYLSMAKDIMGIQIVKT